MSPRTKEQNEEIRLRRLAQIRKAAADVFLNKGPLLEIRDVAVQAGLGYGTVYHYYGNKGDLLHDLLWDALERTRGWLNAPQETPLEAQLKTPRASASGQALAHGHFGLAVAADIGNTSAADSQSRSHETAAAAELGPVAAAGVRLLQLWAEDHALYLLHKLAGEGFASLPEARSAPLSAAFRREVLAPLAALLETGRAVDEVAASGENAAESPYRLHHAEMLLAALVGCASLSLRRGKLHEEARDIARFLKL
ncbi:TetR family transcriptional regulator [Paenibacillus polymyxa]|uniref:TetR/AcrR family transcriptional regulator n=1 Tax=Paenibacillus polymyxa TaxID=1406 RepID=UPI000D937781|nr:TetR family transcriptional regulator [Paenibacillus polymyxa]MCJ1222064.1 TetR/AcrR family transcriptional regulator [Paenibacillus polymyxa]SPY18357.1 TetR family transcriptional regulator [Paenibacillus polymyxa]